MHVINFINNANQIKDWQVKKTKDYFIVATSNQIPEIFEKITTLSLPVHHDKQTELPVRFESLPHSNYFSYLFFDQLPGENELLFEKFTLYLSQHYLVLEVQAEGMLHDSFVNQLMDTIEVSTINKTYIDIIDFSLSRMFESLYEFEEYLTTIENNIIEMQMDVKIDTIITLKNQCFKVKKYMRMLLYVSDGLLLNKNKLLANSELGAIQNIDSRINRVYEYGVSLYEMAVHLLEIYDSTINTITNQTINKLTVFTVFATPITVLTGIYGMNFINMPELRNPNGYYILLGIMAIILLVIYYILKKIKLL
ncbi:magnesium transporter CorA family protein [Vagococcus xieshaowenii]|uniref:Uncharacterized protein n=1 Tax=Vagococcus xieshaowenii TaxID=2562451 RepID=A0AAJ5EFU9_9ENTE|nr:CorA family divalent cation transporter [Vagococcus xieshaowenii]QCA28557.1 hypothetical protein E4Z98_04215 [Vagococcus xieshaowenii]TFZ40635.1 hypothetical protein E4031_07560 [Vagococcus xieshaowenii]